MAEFNPKRLIKQTRDRFLADLLASISKIENRLESLGATQVELLELARKTNERAINSGVYKLAEDEIVAKIFSGAKMHLDPRDVGFVPNLVLDGDWERNITRAWLKVLKKGDVVVDIGANFGYFGILAAQFTERTSTNIFFEANPKLIRYIKKSLVENSFDDCSVVESLAVADKPGKVKLNILKDYVASSSLHSAKEINEYMRSKMPVKVESSATVQAITLDEYCKTNGIKSLDLIKMDIEGFEDKAYSGMRSIVRSSPRLSLFVEFTKDAYERPKAFYDQLLSDFGSVYLINDLGDIIKPKNKSYANVIGDADGWVMPIFSKKSDLS